MPTTWFTLHEDVTNVLLFAVLTLTLLPSSPLLGNQEVLSPYFLYNETNKSSIETLIRDVTKYGPSVTQFLKETLQEETRNINSFSALAFFETHLQSLSHNNEKTESKHEKELPDYNDVFPSSCMDETNKKEGKEAIIKVLEDIKSF